ncbi:MAG: hypothetical protein COA36_06275 [Desulfotalea sp.]|nr:MAG: hypothetical protein COA36_06275 [Desulfotalea sp.]
MRQIVIDELSPMELDNIDSYLKRTLKQGPMVGLYWLGIPTDLLAEAQQGHEEHGPFCLAVEVSHSGVKFELLVRSQTNLHCTCIAHASPIQRQFVLDFMDKMLVDEMINA